MRLSVILALLLFGCHDTSLPIGGSGDGSVGDQGGSCAGLNETACLAQPSCVADYCNECSCANTFVGCRASSAAHIKCPALGCPQQECCTAETKCSSADNSCFQPGTRGGAQPTCPEVPCTADGEVCVQGDCQPPECGLNAAQPMCPANFICVQDASSSRCIRNPCSKTTDCAPGAVCVDGACFHDQGTCSLPVP